MKIILSLTPIIMKSSNNRNYFTLLFLVLFFIGNAQKISLAELHTICTNKNWETSNKYLISKGWDFYNSSVGDDEHYNTISWSFEKSRIDDAKASGWFYIYTYDGLPNKVIYRFRQKEYYRSLIQQIQAAAYKLEGEEINENTVVATYKNPKYIIELSYERVVMAEVIQYIIYRFTKKVGFTIQTMGRNTILMNMEILPHPIF